MSGLQAEVSGRLPISRTLDEQADSAARKCLSSYGPNNNPRLVIGARNQVHVDLAGRIHLIDDITEYQKTVGPRYFSAGNYKYIYSYVVLKNLECSDQAR